ncbi:hypothetical protein [Dokdonella sp.]|uniref:hypothetical protein n=1 Tax=Dokdonella sp. TaxID=2291710 RepID=UPI0025C11C5D|nr:hypothetical protein [Dokdonella sp.]MBX3692929.1 hypothetical protein [Dokdonella sp.]MCW5568854.1 hypothetical protein [Dokdonella sp.]
MAMRARGDIDSFPWVGTRVGVAMLAMLGAALITGCTHAPLQVSAKPHSLDPEGRMRGYVESARTSDFCPDQASRPETDRCMVTRGFDYASGTTVVRMYDPSGALIRTDHPPGADLSLTPPEQGRVEALVRADPRTASIVNRPDVMLWSGGFVMREPGDRYCDRGSRCIRVIAATDGGNDVVLHSVVDLMTDRVVYPSYEPSGKETAGLAGKP